MEPVMWSNVEKHNWPMPAWANYVFANYN